jgi:dolichyl-phosphate beta-glucosyltransferase
MIPLRLIALDQRTRSAKSLVWRPLYQTDHELTVIVPAYNEQHRLGPTLATLETFLDKTAIDYRILVVDDGSEDETAKFTDGRGHRLSTLRMTAHRGKGAAVRTGMLAATGAVVAFTDADLPYDLGSLVKGYEHIQRGRCEVVFGSRDLGGDGPHAPRHLSRRISTKLFRYFVSSLVSRAVTDTQCGLKFFSRAAALSIFSRTTVDGFAFDVEVVYLTKYLNISYRRIPVTLVNEYSSTLSLSRDAIPMVRDLLRIRLLRKSLLSRSFDEIPSIEPLLPSRCAA